MALFFSLRGSKGFRICDSPVQRQLILLVVTLSDKRSQDFIDTINRGTTIDMTGYLGDDLRRHGRRRRDRLRRLNLGVTHLEAISQHATEIDQHAVKHGEERRIIEIVIMDLTGLMSGNHIFG